MCVYAQDKSIKIWDPAPQHQPPVDDEQWVIETHEEAPAAATQASKKARKLPPAIAWGRCARRMCVDPSQVPTCVCVCVCVMYMVRACPMYMW